MDTPSVIVNVSAGVSLLGFWFGYAVLLPFDRLQEGIWHLATDRRWVPVNLLGVAGTVLASAGLVLIVWVGELPDAALISALLTVAGLQLLGGNLAWESIIWPVLADRDPKVLAFDGPLYRSRALLGYFALAGILFVVGYTALAITIGSTYPIWVRVGLAFGATLFGLGPLTGSLQVWLRSIGITALVVSQIALSLL